MSEGERKLAAIMFTDIVGYAALTQSNESLAIQVLDEHNQLLRTFLPKFHGREIKTIGDSFMVEFESALDAVQCAIALQSHVHSFNLSSAPDWKLKLRIGIHLGDVIHRSGDAFGDAVNIASRIEPFAEPGGICVSEQVFDQVRNKIAESLVSLGQRTLKNVRYPVGVYRVTMPWDQSTTLCQEEDYAANRLAVLPFVNISPDPNDEYFADGLTEEIIGRLSLLKGLQVIARTSVMSFKNKPKKVSEIARELDVGMIVEGSVRKAQNLIRVTVQLINATSQAHLWSFNYDREMGDIFTIQSDIASRVAERIPSSLTPGPVSTDRDTENITAYTFFLRGRELQREGGESSVKKAIGLLEKAVELDPRFARAYCELATCYQRLGNLGYEAYHESIARAKEPLKKTLKLDPDLAQAHAVLSWMHFNEQDNDGAESEARKAIELNPNLPEGYDALSIVITLKGEMEEYLKLVETCYRLDPLRSRYVVQLGRAYFYAGREADALEHWKKTVDLAPAGTHRIMTEYYLWKNDLDRAAESYSNAQKMEPDNPWNIWMKGVIAARTGDKDGALHSIQQLKDSTLGVIGLNYIGFVYHALGDLDSYFEYINKAGDENGIMAVYPMYAPMLAEGRADERYQALIERIWPRT